MVLHRTGWGETPWTRVERLAIEDRFLKDGPAFLFFVMMDSTAPPPRLPETLIRYSIKDFGIEQAVGAIKARAIERGSQPHRPSIAERAARAQEAAAFEQHRKQLARTTEGVRQVSRKSQDFSASYLSGRPKLMYLRQNSILILVPARTFS